MPDTAMGCGLVLDFPIPQLLTGTGQWVLSAMQRHGQELVTMLWRILGNEQDVCDAYQGTFLKLAHHHNSRRPEHIKAYLFRSAANTAISILRRKIIEKKNLPNIDTAKNKAKSPANELDSKNLQEILRSNIARLPENLRGVVTLHDLAELPYAQVGEIIGITEATAKVYRCKAIQMLSVWMNKEEQK